MLTTHRGYFGAFLTALRLVTFYLADIQNFPEEYVPSFAINVREDDTVDVFLWNYDRYMSIPTRRGDGHRYVRIESEIGDRSNAYCK